MKKMNLLKKNSLDWWIDYVEGDFTKDIRENIEMLLGFSKTDQLIVGNIKRLKECLWETRNQDIPESESYYRELKTKIMNQIDEPALSPEITKKSNIKRLRINN